MIKILDQNLRYFVFYSLVIFLVLVPTYYVLVDMVWLDELDENNQIVAQRVVFGINKLNVPPEDLERSLDLWSKIHSTVEIVKLQNLIAENDTAYTVEEENIYQIDEINRFRVLSKVVLINGEKYQLIVKTNIEEVEEIILYLSIAAFFFFIALIIGFLFLNKKITNVMLIPFRDTLSKLRNFSVDESMPVDFLSTHIIEFEELNLALADLIGRVRSSYQSQKKIFEDASHELQTPIAVAKSKLDLLLQENGLTINQYELIESVNRSLGRISYINKNLLLISKMNNQHFDVSKLLCFTDILLDALEQLSESLNDKKFSKNIDQKKIFVIGNKFLIETLLYNLLVNSINHSNPKDKVEICLSDGILKVSNSGVSSLSTDILFKRFSNPSDKNLSGGLGLSIVKDVCDIHGWSINYEYKSSLHIFTVNFSSALS